MRKSGRVPNRPIRLTTSRWGADGQWSDGDTERRSSISTDVEMNTDELVVHPTNHPREDNITVLHPTHHKYWGTTDEITCQCVHLASDATLKPMHEFYSKVLNSDRDPAGDDAILDFNEAKRRLDKIELILTGNETQSINKGIRNTCSILLVIRWKLIETAHFEIGGWQAALKHIMRHNASVDDGSQFNEDNMRSRYEDHFVQAAAKFFLVSKQMMMMTRETEDEKVHAPFYLDLNSFLQKRDWEDHYWEGLPFLTEENLDGSDRMADIDEVYRLVSYLNETLIPTMRDVVVELIDGYDDLRTVLRGLMKQLKKNEEGTSRRLNRTTIGCLTRSTVWAWDLSKPKFREVAVKAAVAGNILMRLAHNENFENEGWRCAVGSGSVDEHSKWFKTSTEGVCDICGNDFPSKDDDEEMMICDGIGGTDNHKVEE